MGWCWNCGRDNAGDTCYSCGFEVIHDEDAEGGESMIHKNYEEMTEEQKAHVNEMYKLVNDYSKANGIKLAYNDIAEVFVEAIATYIVDSKAFADGRNKQHDGKTDSGNN